MNYNFWKEIQRFIIGHRSLLSFVAGITITVLAWLLVTSIGGIVEALSGEVWNSPLLKTEFQLRYILSVFMILTFVVFAVGVSVGRKYASVKKEEPIELITDGYISDAVFISASDLEDYFWGYQRKEIGIDEYIEFIVNGLNKNQISLDHARSYLKKVNHDVKKVNGKYLLTPKH